MTDKIDKIDKIEFYIIDTPDLYENLEPKQGTLIPREFTIGQWNHDISHIYGGQGEPYLKGLKDVQFGESDNNDSLS